MSRSVKPPTTQDVPVKPPLARVGSVKPPTTQDMPVKPPQ
jgi:hypothetical protein